MFTKFVHQYGDSVLFKITLRKMLKFSLKVMFDYSSVV